MINIDELLRKAVNNRRALSIATMSACYCCKKYVPACDISWETVEQRTASCPFCGGESIIPEEEGQRLTKDIISALNKKAS